jgi:hypothetical protein
MVTFTNDAPYDPDQDPEEKRQVRKKYRDLNKGTEGTHRLVYDST